MLTRMLLAAALAVPLAGCDKDVCAVPSETLGATTAIGELTPAAVVELIEREPSTVIVDVNPRRIYDASHVPGARWMPSGELRFSDLPVDRATPVVFYCYNEVCGASHQAATTAVERGWMNVSRMPAGIVGWKAAGLSVEPSKAVPERAVVGQRL